MQLAKDNKLDLIFMMSRIKYTKKICYFELVMLVLL